jgi:hypothetical protein
VTYCRSHNIKLSIYVDDIILSGNRDTIHTHRDFVLKVLRELGWFINQEKSSLEPSVCKNYIGYTIQTVNDDGNVWISIPNVRISAVRRDIKRALKKGWLSARALARIAGQLISMSKAVIPAKLLLRNLYGTLKKRSSWQDILILDEYAVADLKWWIGSLAVWNGRAIIPHNIDIQMTTDASSVAWGAVLGDKQAQGYWNQRLSYMPSNYRELMAIRLALVSFTTELRGKTVQILTDNITSAAYINFQGGPSQELTDVARAIWDHALQNNIGISAKHLAGSLNLEADWLSRLPVSPSEWKLNPRLFCYLNTLWGPHTIDRFSTMINTHLKCYNSRFWDPLTHGVDALAQNDWSSHNNFVNPPWRLLNKILDVVVAQGAAATIIAPRWPSQRWFYRLKALSIAPPVPIPNNHMACHSMGTKLPEPLHNRKWKLYAWRICGRLN